MQRIRFSVKIPNSCIRQFVTILSINKTMDMALMKAVSHASDHRRRMDAFSVLSFWAGHVCDGLFFFGKTVGEDSCQTKSCSFSRSSSFTAAS